MARKKLDIDFTKIAKTVAGGAAAGFGEKIISDKIPMVNSNPLVQKMIPIGMGLVVDLLLPNQPDIAAGMYGAGGYKLAEHFNFGNKPAVNGTPSAINGTPSAINGYEELQAMKKKAQKLVQMDSGSVENFAEKNRNKNLKFK